MVAEHKTAVNIKDVDQYEFTEALSISLKKIKENENSRLDWYCQIGKI